MLNYVKTGRHLMDKYAFLEKYIKVVFFIYHTMSKYNVKEFFQTFAFYGVKAAIKN